MKTLLKDLLTEAEVNEAMEPTRARLAAYLGRRRAIVEIDGDLVVAQCLAILDEGALVRGAEIGSEVAVVFGHGSRQRPIITAVRDGAEQAAPPVVEPATPCPVRGGELSVRVDGESRPIRVTARQELVLECGSASITLRRDGRVTIKGSYVETYATGTNRIKGAQVRIN